MENRQRVAFAGERREGRKNDVVQRLRPLTAAEQDRKSTRLNSSHCNLVCRLLLEKKKSPLPSHPVRRHREGCRGGLAELLMVQFDVSQVTEHHDSRNGLIATERRPFPRPNPTGQP